MTIKCLIITENPKKMGYGDIKEREVTMTTSRRPPIGDNVTEEEVKLKVKVNNHNRIIAYHHYHKN